MSLGFSMMYIIHYIGTTQYTYSIHYKLSIVHRENNVTICQLYFFYLSQCQVKLIRVDNNIKLVNILWFPSRYYLILYKLSNANYSDS